MSRVFVPPRYTSTIQNTVLNIGAETDAKRAFVNAAFDLHISAIPEDEAVEIEEAAALGERKGWKRYSAYLQFSQLVRTFCAKSRVFADDHAMFAFVNAIVSGRIEVDETMALRAERCEAVARETATVGLIASMASPHLAAKKVRSVLLPHQCKRVCIEGYRALCMDTLLRLHASSPGSRAAFRKIMSGTEIPDADEFLLPGALLTQCLRKCDVALFGAYLCIRDIHNDEVYVFDPTSRAFTSDILHTYSRWVSSAAATHGDAGIAAATIGVRYVVSHQTAHRLDIDTLRKLARQMKSSYAISQCEYAKSSATESERELIESQTTQLFDEVFDSSSGEAPWIYTLRRFSDNIAIDLGTAWHLLPPPDCDARATNAAIKRKYNARRVYNEEAWADFISYSSSVISAHYLISNRTTDVEWDREGAEDMEWVKQCRSGILSYPARDDRARIVNVFSWQHHLESWGWTAQDVTHVWADATDQSRATIDNELEYFIQNGNLFSGKITASEVRDQWRSNSFTRKCTLYAAVKSENTKVPGKQRETMSADDITRECLTEVDMNVARIAKLINGVASRAGRKRTEIMTNGVLKKVHNGGMLISLDVSGWSPNMHRRGELAFIDMLLKFFNQDDIGTASAVFRSTFVQFAKSGMDDFWEATDGSIQGFFGTSDSILHSLMAQWCVNRMKEDGALEKTATIDKLTLIDDILAAMTGMKKTPATILALFISYYKKLGFEVDAVKTIARADKGVFLNRFYSGGHEVVTCNKIAAKADRAWESQWISPTEECGTIFNAFAGACDRGACPVSMYTHAILRCYQRLAEVSRDVLSRGMLFSHVQAWIPTSYGGLGFPSMATWLTRAAPDAADIGFANVFAVRDLYRSIFDAHGNEAHNTIANEMDTYLSILANAPLETRSAVACATDPLAIRMAGLINPGSIRAALAEDGLKKLKPHAELKQLIQQSQSAEYEGIIDGVLSSGPWPADIISEWASCLPHFVASEVTARIESSDRVLRAAGKRHREKAWSAFKRSCKVSVTFNTKLCSGVPAQTPLDAIGYVSFIRARANDKYKFVNAIAPSPAAFIRQSGSDADLRIFLKFPEIQDVNTPPKGEVTTLRRSDQADRADGGVITGDRDPGPIAKAVRRFAALLAYAGTANRSPAALEDAFNLLWAGKKNTFVIRRAAVSVSNTFRVCTRFASIKHTVAALPNVAPYVKVAANAAIKRLENIPRAFSWLSVVYWLKAAAIADIASGFRAPVTRNYTLTPDVIGLKSDPQWPTAVLPEETDGLFPFANSVLAACADLAADNVAFVESDSSSDDDDFDHDPEFAVKLAGVADRTRVSAMSVLANAAPGSLMDMLVAGAIIDNESASSAADVNVPSHNASKKAARTANISLEGAIADIVAAALAALADGDVEDAARAASAAWAAHHAGRFASIADLRVKWLQDLFSPDPHKFNQALAKSRILTSRDYAPGNVLANYDVAAAEHKTKSRDAARTPALRYRSHFLSYMMMTVAAERSESFTNAVIAAIRGYTIACSHVVRRTMATGGSETYENANKLYRSAIEASQGGDAMSDIAKRIFDNVIPADFVSRADAIAGSVGAVRTIMSYLAKDFLEPELIRDQINSSATKVPTNDDDDDFFGGNLDMIVAPGANVVSDADIVRWATSIGRRVDIEAVRADADLLADVAEFIHEDKQSQHADV